MDCIHASASGYTLMQGDLERPSAPGYRCRVTAPGGVTAYFDEASCQCSDYVTGFGKGVRAVYRDFPGIPGLVLECRIWTECTTGDAIFELIPIQDAEIEEIFWPAPLAHPHRDGWTVLPILHGCILPNYTRETLPRRWPEESWYKEDGRYTCTRSMFMQFFGQYDPLGGLVSIFETRWDAGMEPDCGDGRPVQILPLWRESLGRVGYGRKLRVKALEAGCDYNDVCKAYRQYIRSIGELVTLREKAVANPVLNRLSGSPIVLTYIWHHNVPGSRPYDPARPEWNDRKQSFAEVDAQLHLLRQRGLTRAVVHLDGWGRRGYDNLHPDLFPPAPELGGWDGLRQLERASHELGYLFGLHDQYRDYYRDADTFDESLSVVNRDGSVPGHHMWEGGEQTLLCATHAADYVRRNYDTLRENGVSLDFAYLDVFSSVPLDECYHPQHRMTRRECAAYRMRCYRELDIRGILSQSEDAIDWCLPALAFVHHAPYPFHEDYAGQTSVGISVPLHSLVYHDCVIMPWFREWNDRSMLDGILTGSATYVPLGSDETYIAKALEISDWQRDVQMRELLRHELVDGDPMRQRAIYAGGYSAEVNYATGIYTLTRP